MIISDKSGLDVVTGGRMVLLYQLDCNKVLHLMDPAGPDTEDTETHTAASQEQLSDYWDNNLR